MNVSELMTHPVRTCRPEDSCAVAAQQMWDGDCGCVVVTDELGRLAGVVTDRDLCMATFTTGRPLDSILVARVMGAPVRSCRPEDSLTTALNAFATHQLHRLPVVDQVGKLVGLIALSDIARHAATKGDTAELSAAVLRSAARVTQPRTTSKKVERSVEHTVEISSTAPGAAVTRPAETTKVAAAPSAAAGATKATKATEATPAKATPASKATPAKAAPASKTDSAKPSAPPKSSGTGSTKPRNKR